MRRAVYAGSFDPITNGHLWMVEQGAALFDELVVAIGVNPDKRYRFTLDQRLAMLRESTARFPNVRVASFENLFLVHYARQVGAAYILRGVRNEQDYGYERGMRYVNAEFSPDVTTVFLVPPRELVEVSSSFVKGLVGPEGWQAIVARYVPEPVRKQMVEGVSPATSQTTSEASPENGEREGNGQTAVPVALEERWAALWRRVGAIGDCRATLKDLTNLYDRSGRFYHTTAHLGHCLAEFDAVRHLCDRPDAVEAAIFYHDAVYEPLAKDNEERSARLAAETLRAHGVGETFCQAVAELILVTRHGGQTPATDDGALLADLDLAILGRPAPEFDAYERAIRREYAEVPEAAFRSGRAAILRRMLARPHIYFTGAFHQKYEEAARANLKRSLERLEA